MSVHHSRIQDVVARPPEPTTHHNDPASAATTTRHGDRPGARRHALQRLFADGRAPIIWGVAWGAIQAAAPLGFWWLDPATVYALSLALIAAVYIGFAVADGRPAVIAVECTVASAFVVLAAAGIIGPAWLIVVGFAAHGLKDLWQHHSLYVANTRWWPPFCMTIDWVAAAVIAVAIVSGATLHQ
jgi:hypothetical protein